MRAWLAAGLGLVVSAFGFGCGDDTTGTGAGIPNDPYPIVVETSSGEIEGAYIGNSRVFLGIPYAAPPIGPLRWKSPAPHPKWTERRSTITRGAMCAQANPLDGEFAAASSEDCLTLNVWAPAYPRVPGVADGRDTREVFVWIHGGGYVQGSGNDFAYDGQQLSEATGAIVVTINYRLGPLGFLGLPELAAENPARPATGTYGLEDQRAALAWLRENAHIFNGDGYSMTIFGESAGGASVCQHMVSPESSDLFADAIIQSGPCDLVVPQSKAFAQGADFLTALGCTGSDALGCARGKTTAEVISALPPRGFGITNEGPSWYPMVDGVNLPDVPSVLLAAGEVDALSVLLGSNADEASLFFVLGDTTVADEADFLALAEQRVPGRGAEIVSQYPTAEYGTPQDAAIAAFGDAGFVCPTRRAARALSAAGLNTHLYHFQYGPQSLFGDLGAFHSAEIKFVFGNPGQLTPLPFTDEELAMSAEMMHYWTSEGFGSPDWPSPVYWPLYEPATEEHLVLDLTISTGSDLRRKQCDFWDGVPVPL